MFGYRKYTKTPQTEGFTIFHALRLKKMQKRQIKNPLLESKGAVGKKEDISPR